MFINVNNIRLYYEKHGEGNPLILLHGNEENHFIFDETVEKLKKYFKEVIIMSEVFVRIEKAVPEKIPVSFLIKIAEIFKVSIGKIIGENVT